MAVLTTNDTQKGTVVMAKLTLSEMLDRTKPAEPKHLERWSMPPSYFGASWADYYSAGVGQSRDSDCLEQSNFALMLEALRGESETVIVVRESHWAVGWVEWIDP